MWPKTLFLILIVGALLTLWVTPALDRWLAERDAPSAWAGPNGASHERPAVACFVGWLGQACQVVGSLGLLFCGVTRSNLIGRPGY